MKIKNLFILASALTIGASVAPCLSACAKNNIDTVTSISVVSKKEIYYYGDTLTNTDFDVTATFKSGKTETINYDSTGNDGYTIESDITIGHKFVVNDIGKEVTLKFKFKDSSYDLKIKVDYSSKVNFDIVGASITSISLIAVDRDVIVTYKPENNDFYTNIEETYVEINGQTYTVYDEMCETGDNRVKLEYANESNDRVIRLIVDKTIVKSDSMKISIFTNNYEGAGVVHFIPDSKEHCSIDGTTIQAFKLNNTKWGWLTKPNVKAEAGWMFTKWVDTNGNEFTDNQVFSDDFTAIAKCEQSTIEVQLVADNGSVSQDKIMVPSGIRWGLVSDKIKVTPNAGFKFECWVDENGYAIDPSYQVDSTFKATAKCSAITYRYVQFSAGEHGSLSGETKPQVETGVKFSSVPKPQTIPESSQYRFRIWTYENGSEVKPDDVINYDTKIIAKFVHNSENVFFSMVEENGTWYKDAGYASRGLEKNLPWAEIIPGWDVGRHWAKKPYLDENENKLILSFCVGKRNLDFRFIAQILKISIHVNPHETRKIAINVKTKTDLWNDKTFLFNNDAHSTMQIFKLDSINDHPDFFNNLWQENAHPSKKDNRSCFVNAGVCEATGEGGWGEYHTTHSLDRMIEYQCTNDTAEEKVFDYYIMASFLIDGKSKPATHHDGSTDFTFSFTELH